MIDVVELLRADVDAWKIGRPPAGEPPPKPIVGRRPGFVDADTALSYLRRMVEMGLSDQAASQRTRLRYGFQTKKTAEKRGEAAKDEG